MSDQRDVQILGQNNFRLGALYDARKEQVLVQSLWNPSTIDNVISTVVGGSGSCKLMTGDRLDDKTDLLKVDAELKLSFLAGMVQVQGAANYLNDRMSFSHSERASLFFEKKHRTVSFLTGTTAVDDVNLLKNTKATHVVASIEYGNSAFLTFERTINNASEKMELSGSLKALVKTFPQLQIDGKATVDAKENLEKLDKDLKVTYNGDLQLDNFPTTLTEAMEVYKRIPALMKDPETIPVPVKATLVPISEIRKGSANQTNNLVERIDIAAITEATRVLDELEQTKTSLATLVSTKGISKLQKLEQQLLQFNQQVTIYQASFQQKLKDLLPLIRDPTCTDKTQSDLFDIVQEHSDSPFSKEAIAPWLRIIESTGYFVQTFGSSLNAKTFYSQQDLTVGMLSNIEVEKVLVCKVSVPQVNDGLLKAMEAFNKGSISNDDQIENYVSVDANEHCLQKGRSFVNFMRDNSSNKQLQYAVLFEVANSKSDVVSRNIEGASPPPPPPPPSKRNLPPNWEVCKPPDSAEYYFNKATGKTQWEFPSATVSSSPPPPPPEETNKFGVQLVLYTNGKADILKSLPPHVENVNELYADDKVITIQWEPSIAPDDKSIHKIFKGYEIFWRRYLSNEGWESEKVEDVNQVYYKIGTSKKTLKSNTEYEFMVQTFSDLGNGPRSQSFQTRTTYQFKDVLNILILGETGVGKSTFINAFCNYLTYESLDEAEDGGIKAVMPSSFMGPGGKKVSVGEETRDEDEEEQEDLNGNLSGQSCTQFAKEYPFFIDAERPYNIKFIDTPGIGDTRGDKFDVLNMENIVKHICTYDELHGIVILLKPNNAKINIAFRYCMEEMMTTLSKDTQRNIIFLFTNARSTFYRPGDTIVPLRELLKKLGADISTEDDNCFMLDSESFRYLALLANEMDVGDEKSLYAESWDRSVKTCRKLIKSIKTRPPVTMKNIEKLQEARRLIMNMSKPLQKISEKLDTNKRRVQRHTKDMREAQKHGEKLKEEDINVVYTAVTTVNANRPRTVCTDKDCTQHRMGKVKGEKIAEYKVCHKDCYVSAPLDVKNVNQLKGCSAMDGSGNCTECKHSFSLHMHVSYDLVEEEVTYENKETTLKINQAKSDEEKYKLFLEKAEKELKRFEDEGKVIQDAVAKFGVFLKHNAIVPFPDSLDEYMVQSLKTKRKDLEHTDKDTDLYKEVEKEISELEERRKKYQIQKKSIEDSMKNPENKKGIITADDVHKLKDELMKLEFSGKQIEQVLNAQTLSAHEHQEYVVKRAQAYNPATLAGGQMRIVRRKNKKHGNDGKAGFWKNPFRF